jgi:hypothetical protein
MTPKEKAQELYIKCINCLPILKYEQAQTIVNTSKKYALIMVDEILNSYKPILIFENKSWSLDCHQFNFINYWSKVKEEIEKI